MRAVLGAGLPLIERSHAMNGKGIVIETDGIMATVRIEASGECMGCPSKHHCHGDDRPPHDIKVLNGCGANVSDAVVFEAEPWKMIITSAVVWLLPIVAMIIGYAVVRRFMGGVAPVAAAFLFLALSFFVLRTIDRLMTGGTTFYPTITEVISPSELVSLRRTECG